MTFDLESIRLSPTFEPGVMVKKIITTIPVRKPKSTEFFRIRPGPEWEFNAYLLDLKEGDEEKYLVSPELMNEALSSGKMRPVTFYIGITYTSQILFLSDIPLPDADGGDNAYNQSRRDAHEIAKTEWIRIKANKALGAYEIIKAVSELPEPDWPAEPKTIIEALETAFKNHKICSYDHPVLKNLRGEL